MDPTQSAGRYVAKCTGCRAEFENYAGGATHCLRCTRTDLERTREDITRNEVRVLVDLAQELVQQAANQASLVNSDQEKKLDAIEAALRDV